MTDTGNPMTALVFWMPMPTYEPEAKKSESPSIPLNIF
jgi:hypothetical protein